MEIVSRYRHGPLQTIICGFLVQTIFHKIYVSPATNNPCDGKYVSKMDQIGNFSFLSKSTGGYFVHYLRDKIKIDCKTNSPKSVVSLLVDGKDDKHRIEENILFNKTLLQKGQEFFFTAHHSQRNSELRCRAKLGCNIIYSNRGTILVEMDVRVAPVTLIPKIATITVDVTSNLTVTCQAPGKGTQGISYLNWFKVDSSGVKEVDKAMVKREGHGLYDKEVLMIKNITKNFEGIYKCERKVGDGPATSANFSLIVRDPQKPAVSLEAKGESISVLENSRHVSLKCLVTDGSPKPSLHWYKGNQEIKSCGITPNCTLELENLKHPNHDGVYTCKAMNSKGKHSAHIKLEVLVPVVLKKQTFDKKSYSELAKFHETAELQCVVSRANPMPTMIWRFQDWNCKDDCQNGKWTDKFDKVNVMPNSSTPTNVSRLTVPPSKFSAFYSCQATNDVGTDFFNITLRRHDPFGKLVSQQVDSKVIIAAVSCSVIIIAVILLSAYCYKRRLDKKYALYLRPDDKFVLDPSLTINEQSHQLPYDPRWEFPRERLTLQEKIGRGAFGQVWLAKAQGILEFKAEIGSLSPVKKKILSRIFSFTTNYHDFEKLELCGSSNVAVKTVKDCATDSDYKDLASELKILIHIGEHRNIVNLLGACTMSGKLCVILEYCPYGDLSAFLRSKRDVFEPTWTKYECALENNCTHLDLANIAYQIARGMDFLSSKKCIHRDLAARNVLVSKDYNQDYIVKIADFGMARDIYQDGIYTKASTGVLPLKWTAPESLADAIYTSQSDVWSYGVVLWEIFTLGGSPYPGISTDEFLTYLKSKKRMEKPECCPDEFYDLMLNCWKHNANERPTFSKIFELVGEVIEDHTDTNATYLRLDSGKSKCEDQTDWPKQTDSVASKDETVPNMNDYQNSDCGIEFKICKNSSDDSYGYENVHSSPTSKVKLNAQNTEEEYVPMLNGHANDENKNLIAETELEHLL